MNKGRSYVSVRNKHFSFLVDRRSVAMFILLFFIVTITVIVSTGIGSIYIRPIEVIRAIFGYGSDSNSMIIRSLRLPRIIAAVLIGASLGVAGAILQGVVRNSLTSPDTIGTTGGATLGAVSFFFFFSNKVSIHFLPVAAILGAFIVTLLVYVLSWKQGGITPLRLVLIGIGFAAAMSSISYLMLLSGPIILANQSFTFMTGSIYGASWSKTIYPLLPWVCVLLPLVFIYSRHVTIQSLGEDIARSVGSRVQRQRFLLILMSIALAGQPLHLAEQSTLSALWPRISRVDWWDQASKHFSLYLR